MPKGQKARLLVESLQRDGRLPDLLAALERERPDRYESYFEAAPIAPQHKSEAIERDPRQLFISHAQQDADFAGRLARDLKAQGWGIWIAPDSIRPGEKWVEAINRGMAESGVFVLVLTEAAVNSRWVQSETNVAIGMEHRGELDFLPLEVEAVTAPPLWGGYQWISFEDEYKDGLENLLQRLQPEVMARLNGLYGQLQRSVGRNDWEEAQKLGQEIVKLYPDYRETGQLIVLAEREEKRRQALQQEVAQLYRRLQAAIASEAWDDAWQLIGQIQARDKNYRDVAGLATTVQRKRRQQRWQNHLALPAPLKRLPTWSWVIIFMVPLALLTWWFAFGRDKAGQDEVVTPSNSKCRGGEG
jgi:hypothetical protein